MERIPAHYDPAVKVHYCVHCADILYRTVDRFRTGKGYHWNRCKVLHGSHWTLEYAGKGKYLPVVYPVCCRSGLCIHPDCCVVPVYAALLHGRTDRSS